MTEERRSIKQSLRLIFLNCHHGLCQLSPGSEISAPIRSLSTRAAMWAAYSASEVSEAWRARYISSICPQPREMERGEERLDFASLTMCHYKGDISPPCLDCYLLWDRRRILYETPCALSFLQLKAGSRKDTGSAFAPTQDLIDFNPITVIWTAPFNVLWFAKQSTALRSVLARLHDAVVRWPTLFAFNTSPLWCFRV